MTSHLPTWSALNCQTGIMLDRRWLWLLLANMILGSAALLPGQDRSVEPDRWEAEIARFEAQDQEKSPIQGSVVFAGSSTIRLWKLDQSFSDPSYLNRGFGGSQYSDLERYTARIILPYRPRTVVLYSGDNDIQSGKSPEEVAQDAERVLDQIRKALPECKLVVIAIKPSLQRWKNIEKIRAANQRLEQLLPSRQPAVFVSIESQMLGDDGLPRSELYIADGLHLSEQGYALWSNSLKSLLDTKE